MPLFMKKTKDSQTHFETENKTSKHQLRMLPMLMKLSHLMEMPTTMFQLQKKKKKQKY